MDYKNGKVYIIRNHCNDLVYVGSTTQSLTKRFSKHKEITKYNHKSKCNYEIYEAFNKFGIENFYMELLELFPCSCKDELHKKEGEYIRKFDSYKNGYNMRIAGRSKSQYNKENKEKIKEYYIKNIKYFNEHNKNYYENNKEQIKETTKNYYQNNQDKMREYRKNYYQNNQDKMREYRKNYYQNNKEKFNCECGGKYTKVNKKRHLKTKKHLKFITNI